MTSAAHTVVDAVYKSKPSKCSFIFCSTPAKIDPHPFGSGAAVSSKIEPPLFYFFLLFLWAWGATWCAARPRFIPVVYILIYFPSKILQRSSSRESRWEKKERKSIDRSSAASFSAKDIGWLSPAIGWTSSSFDPSGRHILPAPSSSSSSGRTHNIQGERINRQRLVLRMR